MKFKINDKVIPKNKSYGIDLYSCQEWKKAINEDQFFLFIKSYNKKEKNYFYRKNKFDLLGNFFLEKDLVYYKDSQKIIKKIFDKND